MRTETSGPGQPLGFRAMQDKVRQQHGFVVPRNLVYTMMHRVDPDGLQKRGGVREKKAQEEIPVNSHE